LKHALRTAAAVLALALAGFGLTGCTDNADCDDAAGTQPGTVAVAAHLAIGKGPGSKSRSSKSRHGSGKSKSSKPKTHGRVHHFDDDCEEDD
jgi:hypothetical protein